MQITPLKDLLLIKLDERNERTASGIYFKEAWESAINTGEILAVGPLATIAVKTKVVINPYALLPTNKQDEFLIKESDVLGVVNA